MCIVDGCCAPLAAAPQYSQRRRLCGDHLRADAVLCGGALQRFCHQCGKLEPLSAFDESKRSCRVTLAKRRAIAGGRPAPSRHDSGRSAATSQAASDTTSGSLGDACPGAPAWPVLDAVAPGDAPPSDQLEVLRMLQTKQALLQRQLELLRMRQAAEAELARLQQAAALQQHLHGAVSMPLPGLQHAGSFSAHGDSATAPLGAPMFGGAPLAPAQSLSATLPGTGLTAAPALPAGLLRLESILDCGGDDDDDAMAAAADQLALDLLAQSSAPTSRCDSGSSATLAWHAAAAAAAPWAPAAAAASACGGGLPPADADMADGGGGELGDEFADMLEMALLQAGAAALSSAQRAAHAR